MSKERTVGKAAEPASGNFQDVRILIAEDSPTQAAQLSFFLEQKGFEVEIAPDGKVALEAARRRRPDLIVSDVVMPGMTGFEFASAVKQDPDLKSVPFILLTSLSSPMDVVKGLQCGADNFLLKPFRQDYLLSRIEWFLLNRKLRAHDRIDIGMEVYFAGETHYINAERRQILDILMSLYEDAYLMNANLEENKQQLDRSYRSVRGLYRIAERLNAASTEKEVIDGVLEHIVALPDIESSVYLTKRDGEYQAAASSGLPPEFSLPTERAGCDCLKRFESSELRRATNIPSCDRQGGTSGGHASIPLNGHAEPLGLLNIFATGGRAFTDEELQILNLVGQQVSVALERVRFHENLEQRVRERTAMVEREAREHRRTADALAASEERFRQLAESTHELFWIFEPRAIEGDRHDFGELLYVNEVYNRIWGRGVDSLYEHPASFIEAIHPDDRKRIEPDLYQVPPEGRTLEYRVLRPDASMRWVQDRAFPVLNPLGEVYRIAGTVLDITDQRRSEEERRKAEAKYRSIFENALNGICQTAPDGRFLIANHRMAEILGYDSVDELIEAVPTVVDLYVSAERREDFQRLLESEGQVRDFETQAHRKDGTTAWLSITSRAVLDTTGRVAHHESFVKDITERRQLSEQLQRSQKMEAIGNLAGGVAHDFNNLLTVVLGRAELLLARLEDPRSVRDVDLIRSTAEKAAALTRQLLAFSRRQILEAKVIDLNTIVADLEKLLQRVIGENIDMRMDLAARSVRVKADPAQIEQVILNLAINARDAMSHGGRLIIEIEERELDQDYADKHVDVRSGPHIMIAVSDNGCGMDADTQERIFEPFFTTKEEGTGLGLATVYGIVKQSGGHIWVYSEPGKGTTFKIYLPAVQDEAAEVRGERSPEDSSGSETILLVEDQVAVRDLAAESLEERGYRVIVAESPEQAIQIAAKGGKIDLLLSDVVLPGLTGPEVAGKVCENRPGLKVLFVSGYTDQVVSTHGLMREGSAFLQKPFTPRLLARKVREVLDSRD